MARSRRCKTAFAVSERLRARTLLQSIVLRHADASPALPAAESARLTELKAKLALLDDKISQEEGSAKRALLSAERDSLFRELVDLRAMLARRYPAYAALSSVASIAPEEAGRLLRPDSVAVTYLVGETRLYALVTSGRRPLGQVDLGPVQGLGELVDAAMCCWHVTLREAFGEGRMGRLSSPRHPRALTP